MKVIYVILATAGWAWLPVAGGLLWWRLRSVPGNEGGVGTSRQP